MFKDDRVPKLVILQSELSRRVMREKLKRCYDCNSNLTYVEETYGIVRETSNYGIVGNRSNTTYSLRIIQINLYCAECGNFVEDYFKVYNKDEIVYTFDDDLDEDEKAEIEGCLHEFNQKGDFTPRWKYISYIDDIKQKLLEDEKKHPIEEVPKK